MGKTTKWICIQGASLGTSLQRMILLLAFVGLFSEISESAEVTLTVPTEHVAFTQSISANVLATNLTKTIFKVLELPNEVEIISYDLPPYAEQTVSIGCGAIDYAGQFAFRIIDGDGGPTLAETVVTVRWPQFAMNIPPRLETSSAEVTVIFEIKNTIKCNSKNSDTKYRFELVHYSIPSDLNHFDVKNSYDHSIFQNLENNEVTFSCELFDLVGLYQVVFKSLNKGKLHTITSSNMMNVTWSSEYAISTQQTHIMPCDTDVKVYYTQPRCANIEDKIRIFKQVTRSDSPAAERNLEYVYEQRASSDRGYVSFRCDTFDEEIIGYCFKYISFASNSAAHEQDDICLSTKYTPALVINGGWSEWTQWSSCSSKCESVRTRPRLCNNPKPSDSGLYCSGESVDTESCGNTCAAPSTVLPPKVYTPDPKCPCGCQIASSQGSIVTSATCLGSNRWIITVTKGYYIKLTFEQYTLTAENEHTKVYVRDGDSTKADLIIQDDGSNPPLYVQTSQNKMWIEYVTAFDSSDIRSQNEGFAATFVSYSQNVSITGSGSGLDTNTIWSTVILLIAVLLVLIIIAVAIFVCYHMKTDKRKKQYQQQVQNQALLVNGETHTSPSHSASVSSIKGSTNISFGDPAGSSPTRKSPSKKRDYVIAKDGSPTRMKDVKNKRRRSQSPTKRSSSHGEGLVGESPTRTHYHTKGALPAPANYSSPHSKHRLGEQAANGATPTSIYSISSHGYIPVSTLGSPAHTPVASGKTPNGMTGSPLGSRGEVRNKSFITAVKPSSPPLAGQEDLSPTTPTHDPPFPVQPGGQYIPMDAYYNINNQGAGDVYNKGNNRVTETSMYSPHTRHKAHYAAVSPSQNIPEKRPPVEGRDSLTRRHSKYNDEDPSHSKYETVGNSTSQYKTQASAPERQNANFIPSTYYGQYTQSPQISNRPEIKPLPLRSVQRPDGQSPDTNTIEDKANQHTPHSSVSNDLSPILRSEQLFPDSLSKGASSMDLDMPGENDFEYDDYIPELPGSYFSMDPHAYTLTWSKQTPWTGGLGQGEVTGSQPSLGPDSNKDSMC